MRLVEATDAVFEDLIAGRSPAGLGLPPGGVESTGVLTMLRGLAYTIRPDFAPASWLMVEGREVVGLCSLVKPPFGDGIDIGYGVAPACRGQGFAAAAVGALLDWAREDRRVLRVRAETSVDNRPSQRVLERNGFAQTGRRTDDEDGDLVCWSAATGG